MTLHTPLSVVRDYAQRLNGNDGDFDALLDMASQRRLVLLGECTHGTSEFYRMRADISRRLIAECGFEAVAVEADWPDAYRLNRHAQDLSRDSEMEAFDDFRRFPQWMWRNREALDFIRWLRAHNLTAPRSERVGFYGLDIYSLYRSAEAVIDYLVQVDPEQAEIARQRYDCLDNVQNPEEYGMEAALKARLPCHEEVLKQLMDLRRRAAHYLEGQDIDAVDEHFFADRNAVVVRNAEAYYRAMFKPFENTWNLRDQHMKDTLLALQQHLRARGKAGRIVVWAHNSHVGDARATAMGHLGEWNLGQLAREHDAGDALLIGFTTHTGDVLAAHQWGAPVQRMEIRPSMEGSYEQLFHRSGLDRFFLPLHETRVQEKLRAPILERAIGVIYRPQTERHSHYFNAALPEQFDAVFHLDETTALEPLPETGDRPQRHAAGSR